MRLPLAGALLLAAVAAPGAARDADKVPLATPTGPARNCVPLSAIRESLVRSGTVIDFRTGAGRDAYRVTLSSPCPGLNFERRFTYATSLSQLCAQDIITVLYQSPGLMRGASCGLAPFQPIRLEHR